MTPIFFQGKKIGEIFEEKKCFVTERNRHHQFKIFKDGFGASLKLIDFLLEKNIIWFIINYEDAEAYFCEVNDFLLHGKDYDNQGDKQLILPGDRWERRLNYEQITL